MRPDFWFGFAITVCGMAIMVYGSRSVMLPALNGILGTALIGCAIAIIAGWLGAIDKPL